MSQLALLITQTANGLYLLCAVVLLFNVRSLWLARRQLHDAEFELERELGWRRQAGAVTRALAIIEVALAIYAISHVVYPTLLNDIVPGAAQVAGDPGGGVFLTPIPGTATIVNAQGTPIEFSDDPLKTLTARPPENSSQLQITAVPTATFPGTIRAPTPPPIGCTSPDAAMIVPLSGQVLYEAVTVIGTAQTANFGRYKFELSGPSTGNAFAPLPSDKTAPVTRTGTLGQVLLTPFQPGTYLFRLAVFDSTGMVKATCTVTVYLEVHPPTVTLTPTLSGAVK